MIHIGIDHHKKYSHVVAMNDSGEIFWDGRLASEKEAFQSLKESLPSEEPMQSVLEAGRNWGILYDALEELELNPKLANPLKMRLIAETFTKTDKIDVTTHAVILKAGLTPPGTCSLQRGAGPEESVAAEGLAGQAPNSAEK